MQCASRATAVFFLHFSTSVHFSNYESNMKHRIRHIRCPIQRRICAVIERVITDFFHNSPEDNVYYPKSNGDWNDVPITNLTISPSKYSINGNYVSSTSGSFYIETTPLHDAGYDTNPGLVS